MLKRHTFKTALAAVISFAVMAAPAYANPDNGDGNGGDNHGNSSNHGNSGNHGSNDDRGNKGQNKGQSADEHDNHKNYGGPDHVDDDIGFSRTRSLAVSHSLIGYQALPPDIAKNVARGKPLPPGIAKKILPASMIDDLPYYPGYEWRAVGDDLMPVALSTAIITTVVNGAFD